MPPAPTLVTPWPRAPCPRAALTLALGDGAHGHSGDTLSPKTLADLGSLSIVGSENGHVFGVHRPAQGQLLGNADLRDQGYAVEAGPGTSAALDTRASPVPSVPLPPPLGSPP